MSTVPLKMNKKIQMVDLKAQYQRLKNEIDQAVLKTISSTYFIGGPNVESFGSELAKYLNVNHVIPCANGTDALQIALMALGLKPGDEVIVPAFTYVATAEVIALLNLKPVMVDVDRKTFNTTADIIERALTPNTKAIVPVHLFGQSTDMEPILNLLDGKDISIVEDNAQSIGAKYTFSDGKIMNTGGIGDIGTTSFYPSKNLGAYGDGGAMTCNDDELAKKLKMVANHGQSKRYHHEIIGCNSRLDAIQAAILRVKLRYLDEFAASRNIAANIYDRELENIPELDLPSRQINSTHVFHQYTLKVRDGKRDKLVNHLKEKGIPYGIFYPLPLYKQKAFAKYYSDNDLPATEELCQSVLSLPMHSELGAETQGYIIDVIRSFFKKNN